MKKQRTKGSEQAKENSIITEEDRVENPIFKAIYKRVRNLTKKLGTINSLLELDQSTLKPQQLQKIQAKPEVQAEIAKNEEFALFYKKILEENGGVTFDSTELIMKVASFLAVGAHLSSSKTNTGSSRVKPIAQQYKKLTSTHWQKGESITDRTAANFQSLNEIIRNQKNNLICRDYISDIAEQQEHQAETKVDQPKPSSILKVEESQDNEPKLSERGK